MGRASTSLVPNINSGAVREPTAWTLKAFVKSRALAKAQRRDSLCLGCFIYFMMSLICLNLILLGIEVDVASTKAQSEVPRWFSVVNVIIVFAYVVATCRLFNSF